MMMTASIFLFEMRAAADGKKNGSLFNQEVSLIREAMAKVQQIMPTEIPTWTGRQATGVKCTYRRHSITTDVEAHNL